MSTVEVLARRIVEQGPDDKTRAKSLGVSLRTITEYKAGRVPRIIRVLIERGIVTVQETPEDRRGGEANE
jgi:DNA-binding MarR family transcriptional regulator